MNYLIKSNDKVIYLNEYYFVLNKFHEIILSTLKYQHGFGI